MNNLLYIIIISITFCDSDSSYFHYYTNLKVDHPNHDTIEGWEELQSIKSNGIKIEWNESSDIYWVRTTSMIEFDIHRVSKMIEDKKNYYNIFDRVITSEVLGDNGLYIRMDMPFPISDRDFVVKYVEHKTDNSKSYKLILCNHVLEHVKDDKKAIDELERILQPSGILLITVPGDWTRDEIVKYSKADGNGHYRDYGLDFIEILKRKFTDVDVVDLFKYNDFYNLSIGLTPKHDLAFVCHKT